MVKIFTFRPMFRPSDGNIRPNPVFGNDISQNFSKDGLGRKSPSGNKAKVISLQASRLEFSPRLDKYSRGFSRVKYFAPIFVLLLLCGCDQPETVTKPVLDAKSVEHLGFSFPDTTYYAGSADDYDYFVIQSGLGESMRRYRVLESEGAVTNRFELTTNQTRWRGYGISGIVITNFGQPARSKDEQEIRQLAIKYRDAYVSGFSVLGPDDMAKNLADSAVQSVEKSPTGWQVLFVSRTGRNPLLRVYVKGSGEMDRIERVKPK
jgi:hypothetical protein